MEPTTSPEEVPPVPSSRILRTLANSLAWDGHAEDEENAARILAAIPADLAYRVEKARAWAERFEAEYREEERKRAEKAEAERLKALAEGQLTPEQKQAALARAREENFEAWRSYHERHADKFEAFENSKPPVDLPRDCTMWAVLDGESVLGVGDTVEEAHEAAIEEERRFLALDYLGNHFNDDPALFEDELPFGRFKRWRYARVQGSEAAVCALLNAEVSR